MNNVCGDVRQEKKRNSLIYWFELIVMQILNGRPSTHLNLKILCLEVKNVKGDIRIAKILLINKSNCHPPKVANNLLLSAKKISQRVSLKFDTHDLV